MPPVSGSLDLAGFSVLRNQACHLRPAHPRHLDQIAPQQTFHRAPLLPVAVLSQKTRHPLVNLSLFSPSNCQSWLAFRNSWICSRLNFSPSCILMFNTQLAGSYPESLQAHLV